MLVINSRLVDAVLERVKVAFDVAVKTFTPFSRLPFEVEGGNEANNAVDYFVWVLKKVGHATDLVFESGESLA